METPAQPKKILVIEDENALRDLYVQILTAEGYAVSAAADGEQGYSLLTKSTYDLILLDIILPKMDGLEILQKLRADGKEVAGSVVLLTNLSQDLVLTKAKEFGVRGYMVKSDLTPPEIISEVKGYLENQEDVKTAIK
jgi:DNA-binding response OmpR family regulator